jgi:hypothetical protein
MSLEQELKNVITNTVDSWSNKFLNRLVNILTGIQSEKIKNDQSLIYQLQDFLKSKEGVIILLDSISKEKIAVINSSFTPIINSIITVSKTNTHQCNIDCYANNYVCRKEFIQLYETYQVVEYPILKNNSIVEVFVKQI